MDILNPWHTDPQEYTLWEQETDDRDEPENEDPYTVENMTKYSGLKENTSFPRDPSARIARIGSGKSFISSYYGSQNFRWADHWRRIPFSIMQKAFKFEQLIRLWSDSIIMSDLSEYMDKKHPLLHKIRNSHWRYGYDRDFQSLVRHLKGITKLLSVTKDEFEFKLVFTRGCNEMGWSRQIRDLFIDAPLALVIYYHGKHVLTVSFAVTISGVKITQVQLRQKKGNRWLYKLDSHYLDWVLEIFSEAFGDSDPLYLVTGETAVASVINAYGNHAHTVTDEAKERIQNLYNRELQNFNRMGESEEAHHFLWTFKKLEPKNSQ